jgi:hypothetical protein
LPAESAQRGIRAKLDVNHLSLSCNPLLGTPAHPPSLTSLTVQSQLTCSDEDWIEQSPDVLRSRLMKARSAAKQTADRAQRGRANAASSWHTFCPLLGTSFILYSAHFDILHP